MYVNPTTQLVAVVPNVSEAGLGIRAGEIKGVPEDIAADWVTRKIAVLVPEKDVKAAIAVDSRNKLAAPPIAPAGSVIPVDPNANKSE